MLTPKFELHQNDNYLLLEIQAAYVKANDVEIYIEGNEFKFYVKPYFLRLYLPREVIEDGREKAEYKIDKGIFNIQIPKKNPGQYFPDLDMLTTLLAPKNKKTFIKPLIEVIQNDNIVQCDDMQNAEQNSTNQHDDEEDDEEDICWDVEQELYNPETISLSSGCKYGFANQLSGVFVRLQDEMFELIDLTDPENTSPHDRRMQRLASETKKFDQDHYLADFFDDHMIKELIKYQAPWNIEYDRILDAYKNSSYPETTDLIIPRGTTPLFTEETKLIFTDEEKNWLMQLPNKEYILSKEEEHTVFLGLVDIVFAFAYDYRTTEGDSTSESSWTISKLSSTLSWLDAFRSLRDVVVSSSRRCLCYPLYRNWSLVNTVLDDVRKICLLGKRWILRCLLAVRKLLQADENRHILNDIYLTDYCIWIQKAKPKTVMSLANNLQKVEINKADIDFNLRTIEEKASSLHDCKNINTSSGSEYDSSSDSTDSLDSDDDGDDDGGSVENIHSNNLSLNTPLIEVVESKTVRKDDKMEVIRTGLEELLKIQNDYIEKLEDE